GQMPLQRVVPKSGFKNPRRVEYKAINLDVLQQVADKRNLTSIDLAQLVEAGIASKNDKIKILGGGEIKTKLEVKAHAFSKSAKEAIEKLEGTTETL
ncbi:MAG TPA: uL15m family ribosomal protein, partial [Prolixibacteraceae bacterium]|nr:uL15m family ribosomal protein [Prolixibacteraceae bacterium]